jgi:hypothetical protein
MTSNIYILVKMKFKESCEFITVCYALVSMMAKLLLWSCQRFGGQWVIEKDAYSQYIYIKNVKDID